MVSWEREGATSAVVCVDFDRALRCTIELRVSACYCVYAPRHGRAWASTSLGHASAMFTVHDLGFMERMTERERERERERVRGERERERESGRDA